MTNDQDKLRPEDAAVSHIEPTAEKDAAKEVKPTGQAGAQKNGKDDDKDAVGLDALNP
jgi:hypothetical protein